MQPTPRQELILRKVVEGHVASGQPVGSKALSGDPELGYGPSTIRTELAVLEEVGLLAHPHTSAGRVPTDAGYRHVVDRLLADSRATAAAPGIELSLVRREVDEAMRATSEALSQVTDLLAIVSAPPLHTATIRRVEVLVLQPQVLMVVVITSTGGVSKRLFTFDTPVDSGLAEWAGAYLNEQLVGLGLGARMLNGRLTDPTLPATERAFLEVLRPAITELADTAGDTLYVDGTARLLDARVGDLAMVTQLLTFLERRVELLRLLRRVLGERDVVVRIGAEHEAPELRSVAFVGAAYGLPARQLGAVSIVGPVRMDYAEAIVAVRGAARELSRFVESVYEE